jgi:hypothetical protein
MLLPSHNGIIRLLPALPKEWAEGEVKGLCASGGFEVNMKWENHQLTGASISSKKGGKSDLILWRFQGKGRIICASDWIYKFRDESVWRFFGKVKKNCKTTCNTSFNHRPG